MTDLVLRLSKGTHRIEAGLRPDKTVKGLKEAIERRFVLIRFTDTAGGTEIGFRLDDQLSDLSKGDFDSGSGKVTLSGVLTLNYVQVRCVAELDLSTLSGRGHLELLSE